MSSKNYIRDAITHAVLNTNDLEYQNIVVLRNRNKKLAKVEEEMNIMREELAQIKQLLLQRE